MQSPINTFRVGDIVNIINTPEFQNITITRISDSGVTVNGSSFPNDTVISGASPAELVKRGNTTYIEPTAEQIAEDANPLTETGRVKRGTYTEKMKHIIVPEGGKPFTIKELADLNDIPVGYALNWAKENCTQSGFAAKPEGQRGKAAGLYQKN